VSAASVSSDTLGRVSTPRETVETAKQQHAEGKTQDAYRTLRSYFSGPGDDAVFFDALSLLATMSQTFGATKAAELLNQCLARRDDAKAFYDAGYQFYEERQFPPASALLFRANRLAPGQPGIVGELSSALEAQLRYSEAAFVLEQSGTAAQSAVCAYLTGFNWLMCGELDSARGHLERLADETEAPMVFQREMLAGMLARAEAMTTAGISLEENSLTAWQGAINGTVLLHESPHGWDSPMHGRYAFVSDSAGLQREGLERLKAVLATANAAPSRIVSAPGGESRLLGLAASRVLGTPVKPWEPGAEKGALVVAWSMESVPDEVVLRALSSHAPSSRLFVHASSWVEPFGYAPEVTTLLHQNITHPYTGGALRVDPKTQKVTPSEPDTRADEALVEEILNAQISDESKTTVEHVLKVTRALGSVAPPHRAGLFGESGRRLRQRAGGPVQSNRFT
jgi:tetratricopeptide (TPR) repeat protein